MIPRFDFVGVALRGHAFRCACDPLTREQLEGEAATECRPYNKKERSRQGAHVLVEASALIISDPGNACANEVSFLF